MPRDSEPLNVKAVVSYDQQTVADATAQNKETNTTQKSIKEATWGAFYAVAAYAVVTTFMWCAMIEQNRLSKESIHQTKVQWQAQNRPWVGVSGPLALPNQLTLLNFVGNKPYTGVELNANLNIRNFGLSPGFKVGSRIELLLAGSGLELPQNEMTGACSNADQVSTGESVIFPNIDTAQTFNMQQNQPIALQQVQRLWAIGCIAYLDQLSNSMRHTKFWIASQLLQDDAKPSLARRENRGGRVVEFYSLPVRGWMLLKTEAD